MGWLVKAVAQHAAACQLSGVARLVRSMPFACHGYCYLTGWWVFASITSRGPTAAVQKLAWKPGSRAHCLTALPHHAHPLCGPAPQAGACAGPLPHRRDQAQRAGGAM